MSYENIAEYSKIQYRNAAYEGFSKQQKREGFGILITDQAHIFIANWSNNYINGEYVFINHDMRAFGQMKDNKLNNFNIVQTPQLTIYGNFRQNLLHGKVIFKYQENFQVMVYNKGKNVDRKLYQRQNKKKLNQILQLQFPDNVFTVRDFLEIFVQQDSILINTYFRQVILSETYRYYGFVNKYKQGQGLGCVIRKDGFLYSCGIYSKNQLNGLGRMYPNSDEVYDGVFKNNVIRGIGVKYNKLKNIFTIGIQNQGNKQKLQQYPGQPLEQIHQIRKEFHLRSIHFVNQIILSQLLIKIDSITKGLQQKSVKDSNISIYSRKNEKLKLVPIQQKRKSKYQQQLNNSEPSEFGSDYIDDLNKVTPKSDQQSVKLIKSIPQYKKSIKSTVQPENEKLTVTKVSNKRAMKQLPQIEHILNGIQNQKLNQNEINKNNNFYKTGKKRQVWNEEQKIIESSPNKNINNINSSNIVKLKSNQQYFQDDQPKFYEYYERQKSKQVQKKSKYTDFSKKEINSTAKTSQKQIKKTASSPNKNIQQKKIDLHQIYKETGLKINKTKNK